MNERNLGLLAGVITLAVAIMTIRSGVLNPTGAAVVGGVGGSLLVAVIMLVIALTLFAKYFGLIR